LFRGSYEMASKAVYQAKKYQREDNIKEEYQVLFLQFSNPQLFNGEEVTRQFSILEKYTWAGCWKKAFTSVTSTLPPARCPKQLC
jgi:hypothetical protein